MKGRIFITFCIVAGLIMLIWCYGDIKNNQRSVNQETKSLPTIVPSPAVLGVRQKITDCKIQGQLPDKDCTPGAILAMATKEKICIAGYSREVRKVTEKTKKDVYREYGILTHYSGEYEIDHLIPLELGGSNDLANLWPEAAIPDPGYHEKDKIENWLHRQVCEGKMSLDEAQFKIASDWTAVTMK